ncbi:MAG: hypothetical protein AAGJ10_18780 [Bacteroidota bacterium]
MPLFKRQSSPEAQRVYRGKVSAQLKDLCDTERSKLGLGSVAFVQACVEQMEPDALAMKSPSFAWFRREVEAW